MGEPAQQSFRERYPKAFDKDGWLTFNNVQCRASSFISLLGLENTSNPSDPEANNRSHITTHRASSGNLPDWLEINDLYNRNQNSEFIQGFWSAHDRARQEIDTNPILQDLLKKESWSRDDRELWESTVSGIVSNAVDEVPLFDQYRTGNVQHTLNNLTNSNEYDCDKMTFVEGSIMQLCENAYLPASGDYYKSPGEYYFFGNAYMDSKFLNFHANILSEKTCNIIEATHDPDNPGTSPYLKNVDSEQKFEDIMAGHPVITKNNQGRVAIAATGIYYGETSIALRKKSFTEDVAMLSSPFPPPLDKIADSTADAPGFKDLPLAERVPMMLNFATLEEPRTKQTKASLEALLDVGFRSGADMISLENVGSAGYVLEVNQGEQKSRILFAGFNDNPALSENELKEWSRKNYLEEKENALSENTSAQDKPKLNWQDYFIFIPRPSAENKYFVMPPSLTDKEHPLDTRTKEELEKYFSTENGQNDLAAIAKNIEEYKKSDPIFDPKIRLSTDSDFPGAVYLVSSEDTRHLVLQISPSCYFEEKIYYKTADNTPGAFEATTVDGKKIWLTEATFSDLMSHENYHLAHHLKPGAVFDKSGLLDETKEIEAIKHENKTSPTGEPPRASHEEVYIHVGGKWMQYDGASHRVINEKWREIIPELQDKLEMQGPVSYETMAITNEFFASYNGKLTMGLVQRALEENAASRIILTENTLENTGITGYMQNDAFRININPNDPGTLRQKVVQAFSEIIFNGDKEQAERHTNSVLRDEKKEEEKPTLDKEKGGANARPLFREILQGVNLPQSQFALAYSDPTFLEIRGFANTPLTEASLKPLPEAYRTH